jgi:metal-sulfur cluster biosynthetic enzyme
MADVLPEVLQALQEVYDPCCQEKGISVVDMGLVRRAHSDESGRTRVELLLTSGWCPFASRVLDEVGDRVRAMPGVTEAEVEIVWDEAWTTDRLSPGALRKLRFLPSPAEVADRDAYIAAHQPAREPHSSEAEPHPTDRQEDGT